MGWKGYKSTMPAGMLFKKMYCSKCGARLKRHKITKTYLKGEEGYKNRILGQATIGMGSIEIGTYVYKCPDCESMVTYEKQLEINEKQKRLNRTVLTDEESGRKVIIL